MTYSRKFNFKNGNFADAEQVDEEFDQLIAAANTLDTSISDTKKVAQLKKITNDVGGVTISLQKDTDDLLASVTAAGQGMNTIYAVAAVMNSPTANAFRGMSHLTSDGYGWLFGMDSLGDFHFNTINNGVWSGWNVNTLDTLWSGWSLPAGVTTITPSKAMNNCKTGWMLVWSDFDSPSTANDFDWVFTPVHKEWAAKGKGTSCLFAIPSYLNGSTATVTNKRLSITNTKITGNDDNSSGNDVVLRYVLEF